MVTVKDEQRDKTKDAISTLEEAQTIIRKLPFYQDYHSQINKIIDSLICDLQWESNDTYGKL